MSVSIDTGKYEIVCVEGVCVRSERSVFSEVVARLGAGVVVKIVKALGDDAFITRPEKGWITVNENALIKRRRKEKEFHGSTPKGSLVKCPFCGTTNLVSIPNDQIHHVQKFAITCFNCEQNFRSTRVPPALDSGSRSSSPATSGVRIVRRKKRTRRTLFCFEFSVALELCKVVSSEIGFEIEANESNLHQTSLVFGIQKSVLPRVLDCAAKNRNMRVARIPGIEHPCNKVVLAMLMNSIKALCQNALFEFWPETHTMPGDENLLASILVGRDLYICKPAKRGKGQGIFMTSHFSQLALKKNSKTTQHVVQKYVDDIILEGDKKFDLRLYVMIKCIEPLEIYLCHEGLVRFCTQPYQKPSPGSLGPLTAHLTNYGINKNSKSYVRSDLPSGGNGSKRSLSSFLHSKTLEQHGVDPESLQESLEDLATKTCICIAPTLQLAALNHPETSDQCFHIIGLDVLLDSDGNPMLVEINASPSFNIEFTDKVDLNTFSEMGSLCNCAECDYLHVHRVCPVDREVKTKMLTGACNIALGDADSRFWKRLSVEAHESIHSTWQHLWHIYRKHVFTPDLFVNTDVTKVLNRTLSLVVKMLDQKFIHVNVWEQCERYFAKPRCFINPYVDNYLIYIETLTTIVPPLVHEQSLNFISSFIFYTSMLKE